MPKLLPLLILLFFLDGLGRLLTCAVCGGYKVEHGDDDRDMRPVSVV